MRQLASIKTIKEVKPAFNSDNLNLAYVDGWQVVVRKDEDYKAGDLCVYLEIDSMLPDIPAFRFLLDKNVKRLRTVKLRGNLSQGLIMPLSILSEYLGTETNDQYVEGVDVSDILGVTKYEPPIKYTGGETKGDFPRHVISITDETRVQNIPNILDELRGKPYYISVKCDGTSSTFLYGDDDVFDACSRTQIKKEGENVYWKIANKYDIPAKLANHKNWVIQGEICGPSIQSNRLALKDHELFVFNVWDTETHTYLNFNEFMLACELLELQTVPIEEEGDSFDYTIEDLLLKADAKYAGTTNDREGIVIRPKIEAWSEVESGRLSFKVVSNHYLLGQDDEDE